MLIFIILSFIICGSIEPKIEPYLDETIIETSNSIATIKVRHKPLSGAILCNIKTKVTNGNEINQTLPIGVWSEWAIVESHFGTITTKIKNEYVNDCICLSEVKYFKKESHGKGKD